MKPRVKSLALLITALKAHVYLRFAAAWRLSLLAQLEQFALIACQHKQKQGADGNLTWLKLWYRTFALVMWQRTKLTIYFIKRGPLILFFSMMWFHLWRGMFFSVIYFNIITAQSRYTKTTVVGRGAEHYVKFKKISKVLNRINIFFGHSSFPFDSEKYLQKNKHIYCISMMNWFN